MKHSVKTKTLRASGKVPMFAVLAGLFSPGRSMRDNISPKEKVLGGGKSYEKAQADRMMKELGIKSE